MRKIVQTTSFLIQTISSFLFINDDQMYRFHSYSFSLFGHNIHKKGFAKEFSYVSTFLLTFLFMLLARHKHWILIYFPNFQITSELKNFMENRFFFVILFYNYFNLIWKMRKVSVLEEVAREGVCVYWPRGTIYNLSIAERVKLTMLMDAREIIHCCLGSYLMIQL